MHFYRRLYISDKIRYPNLVKWKLRHGAGQLSVYVIVLPESSTMPEIIHSAFLGQPWYRDNPPWILGIARGREDAIDLVRRMIQDALDHTGSPDIRGYLFPYGIRR